MLQGLFYFLKGYVIINVKGNYIEKFINLALSKKICIFDVKYIDKNLLEMKVALKSFSKLKGIGAKTDCSVTVVSKNGLIFKLKKIKKRFAFVGGGVCFVLIVYFLSCFVWKINIMGNNRISRDEMLTLLENSGIKVGTYTKNINTKESVKNIRKNSSDIAWIGISVTGTKVNVEVVETVEKPDIFDKDTYCNIVSDKDGVIEEIYVKNGVATVKKGDTVKVGDLLVSGVTESQTVGIRYFNAEADIKIRCWREDKKKYDIVEKRRERTGNTKNRYRLTINNFDINFYGRKPPFSNYDYKTHHNKFLIFDFQKIENFEMYEYTVKNNVNELIEIKKKEMYNNIIKNIGECEVVNTYIDKNIYGNKLEIDLTLETIEKCGVKKGILWNE